MNTAPLWLALSLAANVGLAAAVYSRWSQPERLTVERASSEKKISTARQDDGSAANAASAGRATWGADPHAVALAGLDDEAYVARLRELGFPATLIWTLMDQRMRPRYAHLLRAARKPREDTYWRASPLGANAMSREERSARRAVSREIQAELTRLLGGEDPRLGLYDEARRAQLAFISPEKIRQIDAINRDYSELMLEVRERTRGGLTLPADRDALRLLEREQRADLAAAMTPDELLEYELRASPTANAMRNRLTYFEPTEAEYRALVQLQLEIDRNFPTSSPSAQEQEARRVAERGLQQKFEAALKPERYAEYRATTDGSFRDTLSVMQAAGFDRAMAVDVMTMKLDVAARADAIRRQRELTPAQRSEALAALERDTVTALTGKLGEQTVANYRKVGGGSWLNQLRPQVRRESVSPSLSQ